MYPFLCVLIISVVYEVFIKMFLTTFETMLLKHTHVRARGRMHTHTCTRSHAQKSFTHVCVHAHVYAHLCRFLQPSVLAFLFLRIQLHKYLFNSHVLTSFSCSLAFVGLQSFFIYLANSVSSTDWFVLCALDLEDFSIVMVCFKVIIYTLTAKRVNSQSNNTKYNAQSGS